MTSGPMVGAKERGKDVQSTFSASLGKSRTRKLIFGGVLVAALAATGFTQAPSTPTARPAITSISSANTKDISNLKREKQQQIEYFLVNEGLQKVNILFLTTVEDIGRWKEALDKYFSERSSHTVNITVSSPKGGEEGLNNEKLLYYNVIMEKIAKKTTENAAMPSVVPAASNPVKAAIPPAPVLAQPQAKPETKAEIKPEIKSEAKPTEKKTEVKSEIGSIASINPGAKADQIKTEPIIKGIKVSSNTVKKEEPKMAGAEEKKPEVKNIVEKKPEVKIEEPKIAGMGEKKPEAKPEVKKEEPKAEEKTIEAKPEEKKEVIVAKVPEITAPEVKAPEAKVPEIKAPVIKELSPDELVRYEACINKFEIMYNRTSYNTFKDIAEFMRKNAKQKPDILKTIDDVEKYFKSQASTIYKGPSEVETLKQMIEMTVGPLQ